MPTMPQVEREDKASWQAMVEQAMRAAVRGPIERVLEEELAAAVPVRLLVALMERRFVVVLVPTTALLALQGDPFPIAGPGSSTWTQVKIPGAMGGGGRLAAWGPSQPTLERRMR